MMNKIDTSQIVYSRTNCNFRFNKNLFNFKNLFESMGTNGPGGFEHMIYVSQAQCINHLAMTIYYQIDRYEQMFTKHF